MIIKSVTNYENDRKLYEIMITSEDPLPFKKNGTMPKDAINGTTVTIADLGKTFVYEEHFKPEHYEEYFENNKNNIVTSLAVKGSSYTYRPRIKVTDPADVAAVKTAIGSGSTVVKVYSNGSASDAITLGDTEGTNYQLDIPNTTAAGDYEAVYVYRALGGPSVDTLVLDDQNCPTNPVKDYMYLTMPTVHWDDATTFKRNVYTFYPYRIIIS